MSDGRNGRNGANGAANGSGTSPEPYVNGSGQLAQRLRMERKMSSPMAPPFMVSAPGKVIVFGEHSVVHGKVRHCNPSGFLSSSPRC